MGNRAQTDTEHVRTQSNKRFSSQLNMAATKGRGAKKAAATKAKKAASPAKKAGGVKKAAKKPAKKAEKKGAKKAAKKK